ncbi:hypothetical protein BC343_22315 [Mucilaginibacter pedocola]|uniref:Uncharacterized protein n=1 Tax=Mucilaginibacter pedocola TaxID=1792845 RepID=A0A1S9PJR4_9SPHI|nr:hypothetical protein BC343_22315 [Mucilaginibacter pedocola]
MFLFEGFFLDKQGSFGRKRAKLVGGAFSPGYALIRLQALHTGRYPLLSLPRSYLNSNFKEF